MCLNDTLCSWCGFESQARGRLLMPLRETPASAVASETASGSGCCHGGIAVVTFVIVLVVIKQSPCTMVFHQVLDGTLCSLILTLCGALKAARARGERQ